MARQGDRTAALDNPIGSHAGRVADHTGHATWLNWRLRRGRHARAEAPAGPPTRRKGLLGGAGWRCPSSHGCRLAAGRRAARSCAAARRLHGSRRPRVCFAERSVARRRCRVVVEVLLLRRQQLTPGSSGEFIRTARSCQRGHRCCPPRVERVTECAESAVARGRWRRVR